MGLRWGEWGAALGEWGAALRRAGGCPGQGSTVPPPWLSQSPLNTTLPAPLQCQREAGMLCPIPRGSQLAFGQCPDPSRCPEHPEWCPHPPSRLAGATCCRANGEGRKREAL